MPRRCSRRSPSAAPAAGLGTVGSGGAAPPPRGHLGGTGLNTGRAGPGRAEGATAGAGRKGEGWRREEEQAATSLSPAACLRGDEDGGAGVPATAAVVAVRRDRTVQRAACVSAEGGVPACRRP